MNSLPEWAEVIDPNEHIGKRVHVEGWNKGMVFTLVSYNGKTSTLLARSKNKKYTTTNSLYLRRLYEN